MIAPADGTGVWVHQQLVLVESITELVRVIRPVDDVPVELAFDDAMDKYMPDVARLIQMAVERDGVSRFAVAVVIEQEQRDVGRVVGINDKITSGGVDRRSEKVRIAGLGFQPVNHSNLRHDHPPEGN